MTGIRSVALGAALVFGIGSTAELHAQGTPTPQPAAGRGAERGAERGVKRGAERGAKRGAERGAKARGQRGGQGRAMGGLFRDIVLTEAQKTQVKEIHDRYRPQMQALHPQGSRARGDTAARPDSATFAQVRTLMASQGADIRAILTPAQQTTFDRNIAQMNERAERGRAEVGARKGGKGKGARRARPTEL